MTSQRIFEHQFGISEQRPIRCRGQILDLVHAVRFADTLLMTEIRNKLIGCVCATVKIIEVIQYDAESHCIYRFIVGFSIKTLSCSIDTLFSVRMHFQVISDYQCISQKTAKIIFYHSFLQTSSDFSSQ